MYYFYYAFHKSDYISIILIIIHIKGNCESFVKKIIKINIALIQLQFIRKQFTKRNNEPKQFA